MKDSSLDYENCEDEQLIQRLRAGETQIMDYLCDKYKNLVRNRARSMFLLGADRDDLIQEGMIGLFKAVRDYEPERETCFASFAELCITRQMYTAVQASNRKKHHPLNTYISLEGESENGGDKDGKGQGSLADRVADSLVLNPEQIFLDKERYLDLENRIKAELSDFENHVLQLYLSGQDYLEIAKSLDREEKSVDNALQRIRGKVRKILAATE